jgi:transposase-like protein
LPVLDAAFRQRKRFVARRWHLDETYVKINGQWKYLYRAVNQGGETVDFLLTAKRDTTAARCFLAKAMAQYGQPDSITIDKSGANHAAIQNYNAGQETVVAIRQNKYLNNLVELDHCAVKRIIRPMLGFKSCRCARIL